MEVVKIQQQSHVLTASPLESVSTTGLGDDGIKISNASDDITGDLIDSM